MKIDRKHVTTHAENLSRRTGGVEHIVVHYTGSGTSKKGSAVANCQYFGRAYRGASADFFVDDATIAQYNPNPKRYYSWHCGDGHGRYGITNSASIGIEVCMDGDRPYTAKETARLDWLVHRLMKEYGVPASKVVRHYDASRKLCPYYYTPSGSGGSDAWAKLRKQITGKGTAKKKKKKHVDYVVSASALNFREKPSTSAKVKRVKKRGSTMHIVKVKDGWGQTLSGDWGKMEYLNRK